MEELSTFVDALMKNNVSDCIQYTLETDVSTLLWYALVNGEDCSYDDISQNLLLHKLNNHTEFRQNMFQTFPEEDYLYRKLVHIVLKHVNSPYLTDVIPFLNDYVSMIYDT